MRILYRIRQFQHALQAVPSPADLEQVQAQLSAPLMALFQQMQPSEQAHSIQVYQGLIAKGETHPDLLVAALLHDVGKSAHPLTIWERAWIVILKSIAPGWVNRNSTGKAVGWKRSIVVAEQHPIWGADMAAQAGASSLTIALIRRHQEHLPQYMERDHRSKEEQLLMSLQLLDDEK